MTCDIVDIFMANEGKGLIYDILFMALILPLYTSAVVVLNFSMMRMSHIYVKDQFTMKRRQLLANGVG